ncbi:MAG: hypothetical protein QW035_04455 [Candidatus Anstonellales archaeon]
MKSKILVLGGSDEKDNFIMSVLPLGYEAIKCQNLNSALKKLPEADAVISFRHVPLDSFENKGDGAQLYIKAKELGKVAALIEEGGYGEVIKEEIFMTGEKGWQQATREAVEYLLKMLRAKKIPEEEHDLPLPHFKKKVQDSRTKHKNKI